MAVRNAAMVFKPTSRHQLQAALGACRNVMTDTLSTANWVVVTGGGTGIGQALVSHFSKTRNVLTCGRRLAPLLTSKKCAERPSNVHIVQADISVRDQRARFVNYLPDGAHVSLLVQNAGLGDPHEFEDISVDDFEHTLQVNVVAPLALTQAFLPSLRPVSPDQKAGRVLHMGTSVAYRPQKGTLEYGVSKMAFHRLYEQINAENLGVVCGSLSPGVVSTEGLSEHIDKARACGLPHVKYFDEVKQSDSYTPMHKLMEFVDRLVGLDETTFASKEWRYSEWVQDGYPTLESTLSPTKTDPPRRSRM